MIWEDDFSISRCTELITSRHVRVPTLRLQVLSRKGIMVDYKLRPRPGRDAATSTEEHRKPLKLKGVPEAESTALEI